jgi:hypothetical protein
MDTTICFRSRQNVEFPCRIAASCILCVILWQIKYVVKNVVTQFKNVWSSRFLESLHVDRSMSGYESKDVKQKIILPYLWIPQFTPEVAKMSNSRVELPHRVYYVLYFGK